jgi:hypothetical protein
MSWGPVIGNNLKDIVFSVSDEGFKSQLHEDLYDKDPYQFYKLFVTTRY